MKKEKITFLGVGDIIIDRETPETIFQHVTKELQSADIAFANCDQIYSDKGQKVISWHYTPSDPKNIPVLLSTGLDVISLANNHVMDYGKEGLLDTMARLQEAGLPYVGVGKNLTEARHPIIMERKGNKIGFLAYSCVQPKGWEAEDNKPGLAPVRAWTIYEQVDYPAGSQPRIVTVPYHGDLMSMIEDIKKLKAQVDVVIISFHWGLHMLPRTIPMYCFDVSHAANDSGADLILGTHPHILKGIEVYKGKAIFYSTGNFAAEIGPALLNSPEPEVPIMVRKWFISDEARKTLIVKAIIKEGEIKKVSYIPCYINENSEPVIFKSSEPQGQEVFEYVKDISRNEKLNVCFKWDGDEVLVMPENTS